MTTESLPFRLTIADVAAKREFQLIDSYYSLTPKFREMKYQTLSAEEKRIIRQAGADNEDTEFDTSEWVYHKTTMNSKRCDHCRRIGRWRHEDGRVRCKTHLETE